MTEKNILLALADARMAAEVKASLGEAWAVTIAEKPLAALAAVQSTNFAVLVTDLELFPADGREFVNLLDKTSLETIRLVLASKAYQARLMKEVDGHHQFMPMPCEALIMTDIIERSHGLDISIANEEIRKLVSQIRTFPTMASICLEIQSALNSPKVSTAQIASIIARDMAMTTKLLQLLNSAGFGLSRQIVDLNEAVGLLGLETVKSMVITIKLMSEFDHIKPVYFSIDRLWRRSTAVARTAREISLLNSEDPGMAEAAFAAGLLHDVGKAVLASTFDEQYQAVQMVALEQQSDLWKTEKKNFGASHGEIGAYLLSLWGMPLDLLEASALHDHPSSCVSRTFSPLTAVHIANVWEAERHPENDDFPGELDTEYLAAVGVLDRLPAWRKAMSLPAMAQSGKAQSAASRKNPETARQKELARASTGTQWQLIAAGVVVVLLIGWFAFGPVTRVSAKFENLLGGNTTATAPTHETNSAVAAPVAPSVAPSRETPVEKLPVSATNTPAQAQPKPVIFPELKVSALFYSANNPSAIINGRLVHVNSDVDGVRVLEIGTSTVVVEFQNQKKTLAL